MHETKLKRPERDRERAREGVRQRTLRHALKRDFCLVS